MNAATVIAVCPVFNPPPGSQQRIADLDHQVDQVIVVDDGSQQRTSFPVVNVIRLESNRGIAAALNVGVEWAAEHGATHVLTIDQDSVFPPGYVRALLDCEKRAVGQGLHPGAIGAFEFSGMRHRGEVRDGVMVVHESIQSGTLFRLAALQEVGGFNERLVIDGVDTDICLRLQDAGYEICAAPVSFEHSLGQGQFVNLLGRRVWSSKHQPFRRYYITRNGLALLGRHGRRHPRWAAVSARRLAVATFLAAKDPAQRRAITRGVADALKGRGGRRWLPPAAPDRR